MYGALRFFWEQTEVIFHSLPFVSFIQESGTILIITSSSAALKLVTQFRPLGLNAKINFFFMDITIHLSFSHTVHVSSEYAGELLYQITGPRVA